MSRRWNRCGPGRRCTRRHGHGPSGRPAGHRGAAPASGPRRGLVEQSIARYEGHVGLAEPPPAAMSPKIVASSGVMPTSRPPPWKKMSAGRGSSRGSGCVDVHVLAHSVRRPRRRRTSRAWARCHPRSLRQHRAAQPAEQHQDDRPGQGQPQRPHHSPLCAGRVRQWLGAVQGGQCWAMRHRLPRLAIVLPASIGQRAMQWLCGVCRCGWSGSRRSGGVVASWSAWDRPSGYPASRVSGSPSSKRSVTLSSDWTR